MPIRSEVGGRGDRPRVCSTRTSGCPAAASCRAGGGARRRHLATDLAGEATTPFTYLPYAHRDAAVSTRLAPDGPDPAGRTPGGWRRRSRSPRARAVGGPGGDGSAGVRPGSDGADQVRRQRRPAGLRAASRGGATESLGRAEVTAAAAPRRCAGSAARREVRLVVEWLLAVRPPGRGRSWSGWTVEVTRHRRRRCGRGRRAGSRRSVTDRLAGAGGADPPPARWLDQSLHDLNALRMATRDAPDDAFFAAGAPVVPHPLRTRQPLGRPACCCRSASRRPASTLRALARLPGHRGVDRETAEEPGKIMHELRRGSVRARARPRCRRCTTAPSTPPRCGSACCTTPGGRAARRRGRRRCCRPWRPRWAGSSTYGDADGDGFLEYIDASGHGLANQGWKDSGDSVRFADGRIAEGPIALCEVQGYAYEAADGGAALLEAFGRPGGDGHRRWAAGRWPSGSARRSGAASGAGRYPALALDGDKQPVDSLTSNIGHLLGTGLLDRDEERAGRPAVAGPDLDSGLGLRTMSARDGGYSPLSYHCGSVWPHDTAIVIAGLARAGTPMPRPGRGSAPGLGGVRPAAAGAVVRRRPAGAVPGSLPPAGVVRRRRGRGRVHGD